MSRFGGAAMAEAGHPSIGGWRNAIARHRGRIHALRPAARLRGQRAVCSAYARRIGAFREVVAQSKAQDRTLFSRRCVALSRDSAPRRAVRSGTAAAPTRASPALYAWPAVVHTEPMNTKALRCAVSTGVTANAARPNPSIEGTCNIWLRQLSPAPHVKR